MQGWRGDGQKREENIHPPSCLLIKEPMVNGGAAAECRCPTSGGAYSEGQHSVSVLRSRFRRRLRAGWGSLRSIAKARCLWNCLPPLQLQQQRQQSKGRLGRARKGKDDHAAGAGGVHGGHGVGGARRVGVGVPAGRQRDCPRHACRGDWPLRCGVKVSVSGPPF